MRLRATIEYLGAAYAGWQIQPNAPTVQAALENALTVALQERIRIDGSGRTDSGVHASGQVAAFNVPDGVDVLKLQASMNGLTEDDVTVVRLEQVPDTFDPRREAISREYRYTIVAGRPPSPFLLGRCWHFYRDLPLDELNELAACVEGEHDFSAFRAADCGAPTTVRTMTYSRWTRGESGRIYYDVYGHAFLKNMVRVLVGSMVDVVSGKLDAEVFRRLLDGGSRSNAGVTAPAEGLVLRAVRYPAPG